MKKLKVERVGISSYAERALPKAAGAEAFIGGSMQRYRAGPSRSPDIHVGFHTLVPENGLLVGSNSDGHEIRLEILDLNQAYLPGQPHISEFGIELYTIEGGEEDDDMKEEDFSRVDRIVSTHIDTVRPHIQRLDEHIGGLRDDIKEIKETLKAMSDRSFSTRTLVITVVLTGLITVIATALVNKFIHA